ncbi:MAG: hypothetical protein AABX07_01390 [Nanoarchaeota archaeon]
MNQYAGNREDCAWAKDGSRQPLESFLQSYFADNLKKLNTARGIILTFLDDGVPRTYVGVPYGIEEGELIAGAYQPSKGEPEPIDFEQMTKRINLRDIVACRGFELPRERKFAPDLRHFGANVEFYVGAKGITLGKGT